MEVDTTANPNIEVITKKVRRFEELEALIAAVQSGQSEKPDWIEFKANANLARLPLDQLGALIERLHGVVKRGFMANEVKLQGKKNRLAYWRTISQRGFHDFSEDCWSKCYDSPFIENYDYVTPYEEGGVDALDPYLIYSSVLGTWEYSVEDFLHTELGKDVKTIVEPLAGTAEFCYTGHFRYPDLRYCMFDLDPEAKVHVEERRWLPDTKREFIVGNALDENVWKQVGEFSEGKSLAYIGKQSQNFFDVDGLMKILEWGTTHTDYLMLEVSEPYLLEEDPTIDELTRPEMKAAGFKTALEDLDDDPGNPLTNRMSFDLVVWNKQGDRRILFEYHDWLGWQAPMLTALGRLAGLDVQYFHSEDCEFMPVEEGTDTADCLENNTFLLFRKK